MSAITAIIVGFYNIQITDFDNWYKLRKQNDVTRLTRNKAKREQSIANFESQFEKRRKEKGKKLRKLQEKDDDE